MPRLLVNETIDEAKKANAQWEARKVSPETLPQINASSRSSSTSSTRSGTTANISQQRRDRTPQDVPTTVTTTNNIDSISLYKQNQENYRDATFPNNPPADTTPSPRYLQRRPNNILSPPTASQKTGPDMPQPSSLGTGGNSNILHVCCADESASNYLLEVLLSRDPALALVTDENGFLPLHHAILTGNVDKVMTLLSAHPPTANARAGSQETTLSLALKNAGKRATGPKVVDIIERCTEGLR
eukprot:CAMPEP_0172516240 /NCGR_PEP_ID=MMETSP1066-20121228/274575_1 /TAXON_ID=671091 /ORGANISM="Coscinodiscus wailesii, Strain CCMP2513" /LENGTH=242 /DNA_ID=CAMNT_0013297627 /DNA_START=134 /DNA_END=859 /DNA_ORIENTATION=+